MNVKISKSVHEELSSEYYYNYEEYLFGSRLHGLHRDDSDWDYIRVIPDFTGEHSLSYPSKFLPNIHTLQYDGDKIQYIWMTERQFWNSLFTGDSNTVADIVLFNPSDFENGLFLCRTYKTIKSYLGMVKRDLKSFDKKRNHVLRGFYTVRCLIDNVLPSTDDLKTFIKNDKYGKEDLIELEEVFRKTINGMLDLGELTMFPKFEEWSEIAQLIINSNNIKEFKYE